MGFGEGFQMKITIIGAFVQLGAEGECICTEKGIHAKQLELKA